MPTGTVRAPDLRSTSLRRGALPRGGSSPPRGKGVGVTQTIGLAWYRREDYPAIRAIMADPHSLAASYDLWLQAAENNETVARQAGLRTVRVVIEPEPFLQWCRDKGLAPDAAARRDYAAEKRSAI